MKARSGEILRPVLRSVQFLGLIFDPLKKMGRALVFVCVWKTNEAIMVPCKEVQKANQLDITSFCTKYAVSPSSTYSALCNHPDNFPAETLVCHSSQHQRKCRCLLIINLSMTRFIFNLQRTVFEEYII